MTGVANRRPGRSSPHFWQGLYWRMALYIGAALAAFVLLGIGSVVFIASKQLESYSATRHSDLGQRAADVLNAEGPAGLRRWLVSAAVPSDVTIYVLDQGSRDILGREIPPEYRDFVRDFVVGPAVPAEAHYQPVRLAPRLVGPAGETYAFLPLPNQIKLWGSPATALGLAIVAVLVMASVAWLIARTVGRPIGQLQQAVRELADGRVEARAPASVARRPDELGVLAADFNIMAEQLSGLLEGRQQLMAELSHELRSPLARLQAAVALAVHRHSLAPAERQRMEDEIERMDRVIGDLLRFSRLGVAATLARRLLRLEDIIETLTRDEEIEAAAHACEIKVQTGRGLAVVGDPELLRSGLENILRNAIRYAPPGSSVEIAAGREGDAIVTRISDRGPGVPPEFLGRIFEPYFRVPGNAAATGVRPASAEGGTGLGLAIARRVFEVHGGHVTAMARDGGGLTVSISLPAAELS